MPTTPSHAELGRDRRHRIVVGLVALLVFALLVLVTGGGEFRPEIHRLIMPGACAP